MQQFVFTAPDTLTPLEVSPIEYPDDGRQNIELAMERAGFEYYDTALFAPAFPGAVVSRWVCAFEQETPTYAGIDVLYRGRELVCLVLFPTVEDGHAFQEGGPGHPTITQMLMQARARVGRD
jgi:hypothetical protein